MTPILTAVSHREHVRTQRNRTALNFWNPGHVKYGVPTCFLLDEHMFIFGFFSAPLAPCLASSFFGSGLVCFVWQHPREHLFGDPQGGAEHLPDAERLHPQGQSAEEAQVRP